METTPPSLQLLSRITSSKATSVPIAESAYGMTCVLNKELIKTTCGGKPIAVDRANQR
jgi:hypothetical protein